MKGVVRVSKDGVKGVLGKEGDVGGGKLLWEEGKDVALQKQLEGHSKQIFVCKYRSDERDVMWASKGVVVSVINGDAIPVLVNSN